MTEASRIWHQLTLLDLDSATSSPGSPDGASLSDTPVYQTMPTCGPDRVHAKGSATQVSDSGSTTPVTSGPTGSGSSASAALQSSLESRLRAHLASRGSTLFTLTWKERVTPSGLRICALRASARRTGDSDYSSWPTPTKSDGNGPGLHGSGSPDLRTVATAAMSPIPTNGTAKARKNVENAAAPTSCSVAGWPTPTVSRGDYSRRNGNPDEQTLKLAGVAKLSCWPTPLASDGTVSRETLGHGENNPSLLGAARRSYWPTPKRQDAERGGSLTHMDGRRSNLIDTAQATGSPATGSPAPTESRGQLNPEHTRWLQAFPSAWSECAPSKLLDGKK
jgi:hypothetical protein